MGVDRTPKNSPKGRREHREVGRIEKKYVHKS